MYYGQTLGLFRLRDSTLSVISRPFLGRVQRHFVIASA